MKHLIRTAVAALLLTILCACTAAAEETLHHDHVALIWEGGWPSPVRTAEKAVDDEAFADYLLPLLVQQPTSIDVSHFRLSPQDFFDAYQSMLNHRPEYFYISGAYSYTTNSSETYVRRLYPKYKYTGDELTRQQAIYDRGLRAIVRDACKADTDLGRMLRINNYMCSHYQYDFSYTYYFPNEMFEHGKGVCNAYCLIFLAAMNELGIENTYALSGENAMNHIWNLVKLDGEWYHIDVTWNDGNPDMPLQVAYSNFLRSDAGISANSHYGWESRVSADSTRFDDAFWIDHYTVIPVVNDIAYYVPTRQDMQRTVYAYDTAAFESEIAYEYTFVADRPYYSMFNPVWATDNRLYYAMCGSLYSVPWEGGEPQLEYTTPDADQTIFFLQQSGDTLRMCVTRNYSNCTIDTILLDVDYAISVSPDIAEMHAGDTLTLTAEIDPEVGYTWISSDPGVATVDANGVVTAIAPGACVISAKYLERACADAVIVVHAEQSLMLPQELTSIAREAFADSDAIEVQMHSRVTSIGPRAFADCANLRLVLLPPSVTDIAADAFDGSPNVVLFCLSDSPAAALAAQYGWNHVAYTSPPPIQ